MIQDESPETESKKIILVGDGCTGKTALLMVHSGLPFPEVSSKTLIL
jgi:GTPase SAR1 family protein